MIHKCQTCKNEFKRVGTRPYKFCSRKCYHTQQDVPEAFKRHRENQEGSNNFTWIDLDTDKVLERYTKGYSLTKIAKEFNVSRHTIKLRLVKEGVQIRDSDTQSTIANQREEMRELRSKLSSGKNNPFYKHGKHVGKTKNRNEYLKVAKEHYDWKCDICDALETAKGFDLVIHHRDLNNKNNKAENLQVLCQSCHSKLHWEIKNNES